MFGKTRYREKKNNDRTRILFIYVFIHCVPKEKKKIFFYREKTAITH